MKKLIATAAAAVLATATMSAGELKVSGFIRGGLSDDITDSVANADEEEAIGTQWVGGKNWGGTSRLRFNALYDGDMGGVDFRFQTDLTSSDYFTNKSVKWLMAYANFFDGAVVVEGGKLHDRFTAADDDYSASFGSKMGARLVVRPIDGLFITLQGSDYNPSYYNYDEDELTTDKKKRRQGKPKFDANLFSASARFENDAFAIVGGAHFSGIFYGSFSLKAIENLNLVAGFYADYADHWKTTSKTTYKADKDDSSVWVVDKTTTSKTKTKADDNTKYFLTDLTLEYNADPVLFGVVAYLYIADDEWFKAGENNAEENPGYRSTLTPYVQYKLSEIMALRAESTLYVSYDTDVLDHFVTVTPSVVFNASEKADVNVWLTVSSETDYIHHSTGVGVRYNF